MFNLFALTDDPASRKIRFSLSKEIQEEFSALMTTQEKIFCDVQKEEVLFDGKYKPEPNEVLVINDFDDLDGMAEAISSPLSIAEAMPSPNLFEKIKALFSGYVDEKGVAVVLLQFFDKKRVISTNGLSIFHAENVYKKIEGIGLTLDSKLTAIIHEKNLRFHSFHLVRQIFDMSNYYKEATDCDIKQFAKTPCLHVSSTSNLVDVSDTWIRRKLWLISQSQILQKASVDDIKKVADEFNIDLSLTSTDGVVQIVIPDDKKELKKILRFLDEDYYKSPILKKKYITNSKRSV